MTPLSYVQGVDGETAFTSNGGILATNRGILSLIAYWGVLRSFSLAWCMHLFSPTVINSLSEGPSRSGTPEREKGEK